MEATALKLTEKNYFSPEASLHYMSNSQYKDFMTCEAMAVARMVGEYTPEPSNDFLVGKYIHAWNEGPEALKVFKATTPTMFKKNGEPHSQFLQADEMINCLERDELFATMLEGQKEVILTAIMFSVPWKVKIDTLKPDEAIVDLKTTRSIWELIWSPYFNSRVSFVEAYEYVIQFAIYLEVERIASGRDKWLTPYIVAVSKESPPDKAIIDMTDNDRYTGILESIRENLPRIMAVKNGDIKPSRCGRCAYCRGTNKVTKVISYHELEGGF